MDQNTCCATDAQFIDLHGLQQYFRSNNSNLLQTQLNGNSIIWTYPPAEAHAAERAGWLLRRLNVASFLHAQKAQLRRPSGATAEVMVVTSWPSRTQIVCDLERLRQIDCARYLEDNALRSLVTSLS